MATNPDCEIKFAAEPKRIQVVFNGETIADSTKTLVLRDFSSNVKRMLHLIDLVDVEEVIEQEYEIIRIKYAFLKEKQNSI